MLAPLCRKYQPAAPARETLAAKFSRWRLGFGFVQNFRCPVRDCPVNTAGQQQPTWKKILMPIAFATLEILGSGVAPREIEAAELRVASLFADSMVLSHGASIPIWGMASPGTVVTVSFANHLVTTTADAQGHWELTLPPIPASNLPRSLTVRSKQNSVVIRDVVVGEIWHASGQSNMEMSVSSVAQRLSQAKTDIERATFPDIRFLAIKEPCSKVAVDQTSNAIWTQCTPDSVTRFSAAAFYFAREIHQTLKMPIGIIDSSRGGTPIEPFIPRSAFHSHPTLIQELALGDEDKLQEIWRLPGGVRARDGNWLPGRLFNSRIAPIRRFPVRGLIWYQAESNCGDGEDPRDYQHKMRALIEGWRRELSTANLSVYFVQLPGYQAGSRWPFMREQQRLSMTMPNTGMAVTIDLLDDDIHPANKIDVGKRLARWALANTYGKSIEPSGPLYDDIQIDRSLVTVRFRFADSGLMIAKKSGLDPPREIACGNPAHVQLAGSDGIWHDAIATIDHRELVAQCDKVPQPIAIRYGYFANPENCNLYNHDGLPASPFCSDPEMLHYDLEMPK